MYLTKSPHQLQIEHNKYMRTIKRKHKHAEYYANGLNGPQAVARRQRQIAKRASV